MSCNGMYHTAPSSAMQGDTFALGLNKTHQVIKRLGKLEKNIATSWHSFGNYLSFVFLNMFIYQVGSTHVAGSQHLQLLLAFYHVACRDSTQVVRPGDKHL